MRIPRQQDYLLARLRAKNFAQIVVVNFVNIFTNTLNVLGLELE